MKNNIFFIIKPEAFLQKEKIKDFIVKNSNLMIKNTKIIKLSEKDIDEIYIDDLRTDLLDAIKFYLVGKTVEAGVLEGRGSSENIQEIFVKLCGTMPNPRDCEHNTIRHKFGIKDPIIINSTIYYLNAIHKASLNEVKISISWFNEK